VRQGVPRLAERHRLERLDAACATAVAVGDPTYRTPTRPGCTPVPGMTFEAFAAHDAGQE